MSPSYLHGSPVTEARYYKFLEAVRNECEEEPEEIENSFCKWLIEVFRPVFSRFASDVLPSFDPEEIRKGEASPLLSDYLFPETFGYKLQAFNDMPAPLRTDDSGGFMPPGAWLDEELLDRLGTRVKSFHPSTIEVSFRDPDYALYRMPTRVLADLDDGSSQRTICLFKSFGRGEGLLMENELGTHLKVLEANFTQAIRVIRLLGIVQGDNDAVMGLLLTYVNHDEHGLLEYSLQDSTPLHLKEQWARQIRETVAELHAAGIVWGDAKAGNVMIDKDDNTWIVDLGGGYTPGWVDKEKAGTVAGDMQGVQRIVEYIFSED